MYNIIITRLMYGSNSKDECLSNTSRVASFRERWLKVVGRRRGRRGWWESLEVKWQQVVEESPVERLEW
ncbi:hypothetical protein JHK87_041440 [Glycine soja]|nr:hypothetical protein JHK87_041440 [Glycine soja]